MRPAKDFIIFPLDLPSLREAQRFAALLSGYVGMFKVGLELFVRCGPDIVRVIRQSGKARVFLDLKLHDIPATVGRAMAGIAELGAALATVHCGESRQMLEEAVREARGRVGVLGVTVLTSVSPADVRAAGYSPEICADPSRLVLHRAALAKAAGCAGVVSSGLEAQRIKSVLGGDFLTVVPGVRPAWEGVAADDQQRVTTPAQAVRAGADYVVIGRPIRDAQDPRKAAVRIAEEIEAAR